MIINFEIVNSVRTLEIVKINVSNRTMFDLFKKSYGIHSFNNKIWKEFKLKKIKNEIRNYSTREETLQDDVLDYLICFEFTRSIIKKFKDNVVEIFVSLNILNTEPSFNKVFVDNSRMNINIHNNSPYLSLIKHPHDRLISDGSKISN